MPKAEGRCAFYGCRRRRALYSNYCGDVPLCHEHHVMRHLEQLRKVRRTPLGRVSSEKIRRMLIDSRKSAGLTQTEVASRIRSLGLPITKQAIQRWEKPWVLPLFTHLMAALRCYGLPAEESARAIITKTEPCR